MSFNILSTALVSTALVAMASGSPAWAERQGDNAQNVEVSAGASASASADGPVWLVPFASSNSGVSKPYDLNVASFSMLTPKRHAAAVLTAVEVEAGGTCVETGYLKLSRQLDDNATCDFLEARVATLRAQPSTASATAPKTASLAALDAGGSILGN